MTIEPKRYQFSPMDNLDDLLGDVQPKKYKKYRKLADKIFDKIKGSKDPVKDIVAFTENKKYRTYELIRGDKKYSYIEEKKMFRRAQSVEKLSVETLIENYSKGLYQPNNFPIDLLSRNDYLPSIGEQEKDNLRKEGGAKLRPSAQKSDAIVLTFLGGDNELHDRYITYNSKTKNYEGPERDDPNSKIVDNSIDKLIMKLIQDTYTKEIEDGHIKY